ncbi:MAG: ABC transporter substrate-binding protein [Rhodospirillales bacterium 20-60-12]|nr:MAG: ABC transporter substrate-binding protein [Rhodospirillales bacterium 20-60-12]
MKRLIKYISLPALTGLAIIVGLAAPPPAQAATPTLYLFNWSQYIPESLITEFEISCSCAVVETDYDSNSEMAAKLKAGGDSQYDVVVPSSYYIPQLVHEGLLQKLDKSQIPNAKNLLPQFQNPAYDPNDQYSMPYQWGTTGVAYITKKFPAAPDSWGMMFNPKDNPSQPFELMGGSGRDTIGAACAYLGLGFDCNTEADWLKAAALIKQTMKRPNFTGFVDGTPARDQLKSGAIDVGMVFNGDIATCESDGSCNNATFVLPKQGTEIWVDTMAIPAHAPDPQLALEFINFILDAHSGAELSNFNDYGSPNAASVPQLQSILTSTLIVPTDEQMKHLMFLPPLAGKQLAVYNQIWTAIRQ